MSLVGNEDVNAHFDLLISSHVYDSLLSNYKFPMLVELQQGQIIEFYQRIEQDTLAVSRCEVIQLIAMTTDSYREIVKKYSETVGCSERTAYRHVSEVISPPTEVTV